MKRLSRGKRAHLIRLAEHAVAMTCAERLDRLFARAHAAAPAECPELSPDGRPCVFEIAKHPGWHADGRCCWLTADNGPSFGEPDRTGGAR